MKAIIEEVALEVSLNRTPLPISNDGFIGEIRGKCTIFLTMETTKKNIFAINVNGKKDVVLQKDISRIYGKRLFAKKIAVKTNGHVFHTEYPDNHLRLIHLKTNGNIEIWEIAVISQAGRFFVTQQKVWNTYCYNDNGKITCPLFEGPKSWPQMMEIINKLVGSDLSHLPPLSQKKKEHPNREDVKVFAENRGIVVWFNQAQGYGVIKTSEGAARVHWSNASRENSQLSYLKKGELIMFNRLVSPRMTKGGSTTIGFDAIGVQPVS